MTNFYQKFELCWFPHGEIVEINVESKQTIEELIHNIEDLECNKRVKINKLNYSCQCSRDIEEILLEDIDAEISILNDHTSSDLVSPSTGEVVKSSIDTLTSDIMGEITEKVLNVLHKKGA